jgi:hypothetical protein
MPIPNGPQWNAVKSLITTNRQMFGHPEPTDDDIASLGDRVGKKVDSTLASNLTNLGSTWPYLEEEM